MRESDLQFGLDADIRAEIRSGKKHPVLYALGATHPRVAHAVAHIEDTSLNMEHSLGRGFDRAAVFVREHPVVSASVAVATGGAVVTLLALGASRNSSPSLTEV